MVVKRKEMQEKRKEMEVRQSVMRVQSIRMKKHSDSLRKESLQQHQAMMAQHAKSRKQFDEEKKRAGSPRKPLKPISPYPGKSVINTQGFTINNIISDLAANNIIASDSELSFSLTYDKFIVNGKKQNTEVLEKFREKYLKEKGNYFNYSNKDGKIKTESYTK